MSLADLRKVTEDVKKKHKGAITEANTNILIHKLNFDSPALSYLFSGFSVDRIHHIWGPESSGKSSISTYIASQLQKKMPEAIDKWAEEMKETNTTYRGLNWQEFKKKFSDKQVVIYIDYEYTFDPDHSSQMGLQLDEDHLILLQPDTLEEGAQIAADYIRSGSVCCVILDSDAMANTNLDLETDAGDTGFNGAKGANVLKAVIKLFNNLCSKTLTPFIEISQERANMNVGSHMPSVTGGNTIKFAASTRQRITKTDIIKDPVTGKDAGIKIRVRNYKNKTGIPWRDADMELWFEGGFKPDNEYFGFIKEFNLVEVGAGGWYRAPWLPKKKETDEMGQIRGEDALKEWITAPEQKELYDKLKEEIMAKLMVHTVELDGNNIAVDENADFDKADIEKMKEEKAKMAQDFFDADAEELKKIKDEIAKRAKDSIDADVKKQELTTKRAAAQYKSETPAEDATADGEPPVIG